MTPLEIAAVTILRTAPGVPVFISRRWVGEDGDVAWNDLDEWLRTKGHIISDVEQRLIAGAIALARLDFGPIDAMDALAIGRAIEGAGDAYRIASAPGIEELRRAGLLDEVDGLAGGDSNEAYIARVRAEEREARDQAWTALLAASNVAVLEHTGELLINTHGIGECIGGVCTLHRRSSHSMRRFPQAWREDRHLMERVCPHGVGHPDPDDPKAADPTERVHGCDGCCT